MTNRRKKATRDSFGTLDFCGPFVPIPWQASFDDSQFALIRLGALVDHDDARWFAFFEEPDLFIHRSWTGICVYKVTFARHEHLHVVAQALVLESRELVELSVEFLDFLVHTLLLGETRPWPPEPGSQLDLAWRANRASQSRVTRRRRTWSWLRRWVPNVATRRE
jgi:8-oxo-dGTP diphosphatase